MIAGNLRTAADGGGATTFTYDAAGQLTGASGPGLSETYRYDAAGNRIARNSTTYSYDAADRLVTANDGTTYTYDAAGNLRTRTLGSQTTTFTWDGLGRLGRISFADGTHAAYTYDGAGRRVSKRDRSGVLTYYVYDGPNLAQEVNAAGAVIATYVYDRTDHPLSMTRGGVTYTYAYDRLGNVMDLVDASGALIVGYRYDPWGNVIATTGSNPGLANPFRFTGREWDAESGLYYLRARYYDPQLGRFISRDPLAAATPTGGNRYAYVNNNPLAYRDPTGLQYEWLWHQYANHPMYSALYRYYLSLSGNPEAQKMLVMFVSYEAAGAYESLIAGPAVRRAAFIRLAQQMGSRVLAGAVTFGQFAAAFYAGWQLGTAINDYALPTSWQENIGDAILPVGNAMLAAGGAVVRVGACAGALVTLVPSTMLAVVSPESMRAPPYNERNSWR